MVSKPDILTLPLSASFPAEGVTVFTFLEPLRRKRLESIIQGSVHIPAGQEFPAVDSEHTLTVMVPNGSSEPAPTHDMFVKPRREVFLPDELSFLAEAAGASADELLENDPQNLLRLMHAAVAERRHLP